jgi:hypothetical protein
MEDLLGWKPFRNVDPSMTGTTLEDAVEQTESWLRDVRFLEESKGYLKRVAGAWTEFQVREDLHDALVEAYVEYTLKQAGGEAAFNTRNAFRYPVSHGRGVRDVPPIELRPARNPGKHDKHKSKG